MSVELDKLGPLAALAGKWKGSEGLDVSFSHSIEGPAETPYREEMSFDAFGPVENGSQVLYGLDYRTTAWRMNEEDAFHTEVGYWLWDADAGQVMRCFMVPRGSTLLAGGSAKPGDQTLNLAAEVGSEVFGILSNPYLAEKARTTNYTVTLQFEGADAFTYEEDTVLSFAGESEPFHHTDRNRMRRAS